MARMTDDDVVSWLRDNDPLRWDDVRALIQDLRKGPKSMTRQAMILETETSRLYSPDVEIVLKDDGTFTLDPHEPWQTMPKA